MRILLVEDDAMIGEGVRASLRQEGYVVDWVRNGELADTVLSTEHVDLVLLDLGLPRRDGIEVLRRLRARRSKTPVIIVTARDDVADRVRGLDAGADDYLVKPFDLDELSARIRAALRRSGGHAAPEIEVGGVRLDPAARRVSLHGAPVSLSAREYALVEALMLRPGHILSRNQLEERMYGWGEDVESNTVEVYVHAVRRKLGADFIRNVRGVGYFVARPDQA